LDSIAIDIEITQQGPLKKPLTEAHLSPDGLGSGHWNHAGALEPGPDSVGRVLYDPEQPGRGCYFQAAPGEKELACLRQPLPCTPRDLEVFYGLVERTCQAWGTTSFIQDGTEYHLNEIPSLIEAQRKAGADLLRSMAQCWEIDGVGLLTGAVYPIYVEREVIRQLAEAKDLDFFQHYLARKQQGNWYYTKPVFHHHSNGTDVLGVYSVTEGVGAILPAEPFVPPLYALMLQDFRVADALVTSWQVALNRTQEENGQPVSKIVGYMPFAQFAQKVNLARWPRFDAKHVYLRLDDLTKVL